MKKNMRLTRLLRVIPIVMLCATAYQANGEDMDVVRIMENNAMVTKVVGSMSDATFTLINSSGQERVRKTFVTSKLQDNGVDNKRMTRFISPADINGTATLMVEHSDGDGEKNRQTVLPREPMFAHVMF